MTDLHLRADAIQRIPHDNFLKVIRRNFRPLAGLHWNILSLLMRKSVRQLRAEGNPQGLADRFGKLS